MLTLFRSVTLPDTGSLSHQESPGTEGQISYDSAYVWNLKKKSTKELIYKTEVGSQMQKMNLWLPGDM